MKLTIDITGQKGLSNGYYGNDDQTVANPQTQYLAQPGQMVDGFFNPFLRDGFLAPAVATTQTMTTDQSLTKVLSSQIYDELNNNTYFGEYANQLFQLQSPENMSLLRVLNLSSNSVINDLEIYQINGVRKLFYIYNQLNNISMNFNYSTSSGGPSVNYLVVGGGGGGGNADGSSLRGSGGGGGGEVIEDTFVATIGLFSIVVGAGGLAANNGNDSYIGTPIFHVLVGGGGGGGGSSGSSGTYTGGGGGGGGGGIYENSALWLSTTNTITVGSGGTINSGSVGNQGGESSIGTIIAPGGGGGGGLSNAIGGKASGGDGANGGGSPSRPSGVFLMPGLSIPGWGNVGGFESNSSAGGGGGYSGIGGSGSTSGGTGAEGKTSTISGASAVYGSGGGGGAGTPGAGGTNAGGSNGNPTANHCGGGGGGYFGGGQNGGSGVVIVRFLTSSITVTNSTGGTITTDGSYTVITWTTNGTFNFTYNSVAYRTARGGGLGGRQIDASGASPVVTQAGGIGYTGGGGGGAYNDGGGAHVFLSGGNGYYDGGNGSLAPASGNYASGGGGAGAFAAGTNGSGGTGGNGGNGVVSTISGLSVTYGGGGGGGGIISGGTGGTGGGAHGIDSITGNAGTANLGGGGGGTTASHIGGAGGSGVVIISYPTGSISATGGTITAVGENTIHTFTTNGTFQVSSLGASSFQFGGVLLPNGAATPVVAQSDNVFSATSSTTIQSGILTTAASTETIVAFVFDWAGIEPLSAVWHGTTDRKSVV